MALRSAVVLIAFVVSAGCASMKAHREKLAQEKQSTPASSPGQAKPTGKMVCRMEMPTGSHLPERVCTYEGDEVAERDADIAAQRTRDDLNRPRVTPRQGN